MPRDTLHQRLIGQLLTLDGMQSHGFPEAHRNLCREVGADIPDPTFFPDAFRLNSEAMEIELYEVEVTNDLGSRKIETLGDYWEQWDSEGHTDWLPVLIVVNRYGGKTRLDLCDAYHKTGPFAM